MLANVSMIYTKKMCTVMSVTKQDSNMFGKQEKELMRFFVVFYVGTNGYESRRERNPINRTRKNRVIVLLYTGKRWQRNRTKKMR